MTKQFLFCCFAVCFSILIPALPVSAQSQEQPESYRLNQEAVSLSKAGRLTEAYEAIRKAYQLDTENSVIRDNVVQIGRSLAAQLTQKQEWEQAIDLLENLSNKNLGREDEVKRQLVITLNNYGVQLSNQDEYVDADRAFDRAIRVAYRMGDDALYAKIAKIYSRVLTAWGNDWLSMGKGETAKIKLLEAVRYDDQNTVAYQLLGKIYFDDGDYRQSEYYLAQANRLKPSDEQISELLKQVQTESQLDNDLKSRRRGKFRVEFSGSEEYELADEVFDILGDARKKVGRLFDFYPDESLLVKIYNSEHSNALGIAPHWASGLYDGKIRVMAADVRRGGSNLEDILYHEYAHAVLFYLTRHNIPTWLNEGLAQYCEPNEKIDYREENEVRRWINNGQYIPMARLEDSFLDFSSERAQQAYTQSKLFVAHLVDELGEYRLRKMLNKLAQGLPIEKASFAACGQTMTDLEVEWLEEMR